MKTPPIPNVLFAHNDTIPADVIEKLPKILQQINTTQVKLPKRIKGFSLRDESFYDITRSLIK